MKCRMVTIYALRDPRTDVVRYVGQTKHPAARISHHRCRPVNARVRAWFDELSKLGLEPRFAPIREVDEYDADVEEHEALQAHRSTALNIGPAGTGRRHSIRRRPPPQTTRSYLVAVCPITQAMIADVARQMEVPARVVAAMAIAEWCQLREVKNADIFPQSRDED